MSWAKACEAAGSRAPHAHGSMAGPCVAGLTGGSRAGFILRSSDKRVFCTSLCCHGSQADFPHFGSPMKQSFAQRCCCAPWKEVLGVLEQVSVCCCSSSWGHIPSRSSGDPNLPLHRAFLPSDGFDPHLPARACGTALVHAGTGGSHPAPFGVVKSVLSVLPPIQFMLQ